jgi:glycosyltransferase involved in cell wall biosynthesis
VTRGTQIRIGIDGHALIRPHTGIARYIHELCRVLDNLMTEASFFIYSPRPVRMPVESPRWCARVDQSRGVKHLPELAWLMLRVGALCEQDCLDVFWGAVTILPTLPKSIRTVVTVYDLFHRDRTLVPLKRWLSYGLVYERSLRRADSIVAISETSARKLYSALGYRAAGVVRPGISERYRPRDARDVEACRRRFGITGPYIFAVASSYEPRKNLDALVEAFCGLKSDGLIPDHYSLIFSGVGGSKVVAKPAYAQAAESRAIRSLGQVPDDDLALLYCGAEAFVFPSTHEGFGLPVLEARACGAKVVATDIPELREAGGDEAIYMAPTTEGIRTGITQVLTNISKTPGGPSSYTWEKSARLLARLLVPAVSGDDVRRANIP